MKSIKTIKLTTAKALKVPKLNLKLSGLGGAKSSKTKLKSVKKF